jgi:hypothetical protein
MGKTGKDVKNAAGASGPSGAGAPPDAVVPDSGVQVEASANLASVSVAPSGAISVASNDAATLACGTTTDSSTSKDVEKPEEGTTSTPPPSDGPAESTPSEVVTKNVTPPDDEAEMRTQQEIADDAPEDSVPYARSTDGAYPNEDTMRALDICDDADPEPTSAGAWLEAMADHRREAKAFVLHKFADAKGTEHELVLSVPEILKRGVEYVENALNQHQGHLARTVLTQ